MDTNNIEPENQIQEENATAPVAPTPTAPAPETTTAPTTPTPAAPAHISIDDFAKVEIRVGQILEAEPVSGSEKLLKLKVDFGEEAPRQVLSGIAKFVSVESILNKKFAFVTNLAPRKMMGMESQAMIMAGHSAGADVADGAEQTGVFALFSPTADLKNGTKLS